MKITGHEWQQRMSVKSHAYRLVENERGLVGIVDEDGNGVLDCRYRRIDLTDDGFAYCYIRKKPGRKEWLDLRNGLWFMKKPQSVRLLGIDFCTEDGKKLYPRIRSKFIDEKASLTVKTLELQVGTGLSWKRRFIAWNEPCKVYYYKEGVNSLRLYYDDEENYVAQENIGSELIPVPSQEFMEDFCRQCAERYEREQAERKEKERTAGHYDSFSSTKDLMEEGRMERDGIVYIRCFYNQKEAWIDMVTRKIFLSKPTTFKRGFVSVVKEGEWCYVRNIPEIADIPFRQWEIVADDNICVINNEFLVTKTELLQWFKIVRRTDDFSFFVVQEYSYKYHHIEDETEIQITQFDGEGLKMTKEGMPYTPSVWRGCVADRHKWD